MPPGVCVLSTGTFWPFSSKIYRLGIFYCQPVHFGHFGRKCTGSGFFFLSRYILAILGDNVPAGGFLFIVGAFGHFGRKCSASGFFIMNGCIVHILDENVSPRGFLLSAATCWPFWTKICRQGVVYAQLAHFGNFRRECTGLQFFIVKRYFFGILEENVPAGASSFSAGTFWPFLVKMYWPGVFCSQPVHFGHFGR